MAFSLGARRLFSSSAKAQTKVAVLGASGGIGQPLSLLLKTATAVSHVSLYDVRGTIGVAADLSHICTPATVSGHQGPDELKAALTGAQVVVIPAGVPRKPGMTRDDLFNTNASIVQGLARACAQYCPEAHILVIANPVNSTVPIVAEVFKAAGVYNPKRLFGVTTLDVTRARTFVSAVKGADVNTLQIPVIGGHAGKTILPLLSQNNAGLTFDDAETAALTHRIQFGGDEVVKAKDGAGSATLSMAVAGASFALRLIDALNGMPNIVECAYVETQLKDLPVPYFASRLLLGREGIEAFLPLGELNAFEQNGLAAALPELDAAISNGVQFARSN